MENIKIATPKAINANNTNHIVDYLMAYAGLANKQARIASYNIILGNKKKYEGVIGTSILKLGTLTAASVGGRED